MLECPYCGKFYSKYGIRNHIWRSHTKEGKQYNPFANCVPWNKGLTKEKDERLMKMGKKISVSMNEYYKNNKKKMSTEAKEKIKKTVQEKVKKGIWNSGGKSKKYKYESPIAGKMVVDGTWELKTAIFLDNLEVKWLRNKDRFKYFNTQKNRYAYYTPDFYINDWNLYIEVKGYKSKLDWCK